MIIDDPIERLADPHGFRTRRMRRVRGLRTYRGVDLAVKVSIFTVGNTLVAIGFVVAPPLCLLGLMLLASEFAAARRLLARVRERGGTVREWSERQPIWVRSLFPLATVVSISFAVWRML